MRFLADRPVCYADDVNAVKDSQDPVMQPPVRVAPPTRTLSDARPVLRPSGITRRFSWEDALWLLIVAALTTLWVMLLMSPAWR